MVGLGGGAGGEGGESPLAREESRRGIEGRRVVAGRDDGRAGHGDVVGSTHRQLWLVDRCIRELARATEDGT